MNIWLVLWVFVATVILGTSCWSYLILIKQKKAWSAVAKKCGFNYESSAVLASPSLRGTYNSIAVDVFSDKPISGKFREGGTRTIFQVTLSSTLPTVGAVGSSVFKNFIDALAVSETYVGEGDMVFSPNIYNRVRSSADFATYLTKERLKTLNAVLGIKGSPAILIFSPDETILRIESGDPFDDAVRLEKFLGKITEASKIISA